MRFKLVDKATGAEMKPGDRVIDFRGGAQTIESIQEPHNEHGHGGRVYTTDGGGYYASVFNAEWVEA